MLTSLCVCVYVCAASWRPELRFSKRNICVFRVSWCTSGLVGVFVVGAKLVSGVMCNHKSSLKSISKAKTSIFTFLWLTSGLGKISFLGPETPKRVDLRTFPEKNNLISI